MAVSTELSREASIWPVWL